MQGQEVPAPLVSPGLTHHLFLPGPVCLLCLPSVFYKLSALAVKDYSVLFKSNPQCVEKEEKAAEGHEK